MAIDDLHFMWFLAGFARLNEYAFSLKPSVSANRSPDAGAIEERLTMPKRSPSVHEIATGFGVYLGAIFQWITWNKLPVRNRSWLFPSRLLETDCVVRSFLTDLTIFIRRNYAAPYGSGGLAQTARTTHERINVIRNPSRLHLTPLR